MHNKGYLVKGLVGSLPRFYTGRAGEGFVSPLRSDAFVYTTETEARRKADVLNKAETLHGIHFLIYPS